MSSKASKSLAKDDLKRLMHKAASKNKINHPLAKYPFFNLLSEILWDTHLKSRGHKENVELLKSNRLVQEKPISQTLKRKTEEEIKDDNSKTKKSRLPDDFFDNSSKTNAKSILKNAPLKTGSKVPTVTTEIPSSSLPSDFFDSGDKEPKPQTSKVDSEVEGPISNTAAEQIPEGFFDDPKIDAKVRNVEYKNKIDEEWEIFQKVIKDETNKAENLMDEEHEENTILRNIEEIDTEIQLWGKVDNLYKKKEEVLKQVQSKERSTTAAKNDLNDSSEESDEDYDENSLNWRSKGII
ncbi:DgyrCDS11219 [Dimorphilus gyrociliatus]|uniref:DgyrCDS11219 n=1 Tax=Dimorphilus gyrociliatus TaxID=2664684 RepID=A0A7I8W3Y4_9ANNE|nr:DgyrCDS11219 [Dimorphilus gyrociliatus]